ncbi:hypothetical protein [Bosea sp. (in: a-proteobacteria)]|uniref:hypothetical protein n=1 Tax=Bosea sp. (in: a-proteobacteria) TaxID=1871050 RepID=UPI0040342C92
MQSIAELLHQALGSLDSAGITSLELPQQVGRVNADGDSWLASCLIQLEHAYELVVDLCGSGLCTAKGQLDRVLAVMGHGQPSKGCLAALHKGLPLGVQDMTRVWLQGNNEHVDST